MSDGFHVRRRCYICIFMFITRWLLSNSSITLAFQQLQYKMHRPFRRSVNHLLSHNYYYKLQRLALSATGRKGCQSHISQLSKCAISSTSRYPLHAMSTTASPENTVSKYSDCDSNSRLLVQSDEKSGLYSEIMNQIIYREFSNKRNTLQNDELSTVQECLLSITAVKDLPLPVNLLGESRDTIRNRLHERKAIFMKQLNFTMPMYDLYCRCLIYMNDSCAKRQIKSPSLPAWLKLRECGLCPRENAVSTFLYVMSLQGNNLKENDDFPDIQYKNACLDAAIFHDLLYYPNEKTALVRIKAFIADGKAADAENVLATLRVKTHEGQEINRHEDSMSFKRLRTYQPIFQYYCETGNLISAFRIYREMQNTPGVYLIPETYSLLIGAAGRFGWFGSSTKALPDHIKLSQKGMKDLNFVASSGPALFDELCTEMADDILELDESSAATIMDGLSIGFNNTTPTAFTTGWLSDISRWFHYFVSSSLVQPKAKPRIYIERVSVDNATALCPISGAQLRLLTLSKQQKRNVHDSLLQMATFEQEKFGEKGSNRKRAKSKAFSNIESKTTTNHNAKNASYALKELSLFSDWLRYRTGDAYTAIIDGPNVAYYGHGDVRWSQVEQVLNKLEQMGENPLVIMPQKYLSPKFYIASLGRTQELSKEDLAFAKKLIETKKMYVVPSNCLDDYYWMLSSVAEQKPHPKLRHVPTNDKSGRFPGVRPLLVTNDQMRDHRLQLLEPRLFRRWTSCHVVKYHIEPFEKVSEREGKVTLFPADFFSREIQCNKAVRFGTNMAWHFPITEWPEPDRLFVTVIR
jgi:hypothetical protein